MKSPYVELIAQLAFWSGMLSLPFSILIWILGFNAKNSKNAAGCFVLGALVSTHFLWYVTVLGGALATKVGTYVIPFWASFLPWPSLIGFLLYLLWIIRNHRQKGKLPPPIPNE